jgi:signal transduction histidine kinase/CheY-like chemotaxis protein
VDANLAKRIDEHLQRTQLDNYRATDRMFFWLLLAQWTFAIILALTLSPYAWEGKTRSIHLHVQIAVIFGAVINSLPMTLIVLRPGERATRYSVAIAQMLWSGILIHLTGGRIETHFHVFGSLAFLALYREWKLLVPATLTVALDHFLRSQFFPESVFGVGTVEWWRILEHVGWVAFEDVVLMYGCVRAVRAWRMVAEREARLETERADVERQVVERTQQLQAEVAERRAREEDLKSARAAAEAASKAKSEFLANMSHEIRTPMNGVIGFTHLLLDTKLDKEQREHVQVILQSGETLLTIINDILDFSKVEAGKLTVENLPFDLRVTGEQVVELLAPQAERKGIELALHVSGDLPEMFKGDAGRVRQVMLNFIGNAIKFTHKGHVLIEVETLLALHVGGQDEARVTVTDTGIGIAKEKQPMLFREFSQADASTTREYGGTGLGLAISRKLVELMGGKVGFSSEPGVGSKFWFTLPAPAGAVTVAQSVPAAVPDMADMRVLVVDDLSVNRLLLTKQLNAWGITNEGVDSGEHALEVLKRARFEGQPFDIAVLDFLMPEMDGMELGQRIKADPMLANTSLVMLTSGSQKSAADSFLLAGFSAFLCKPVVRPSQLFDALVQAWNAQPSHQTEAVIAAGSTQRMPAIQQPRDPALSLGSGDTTGAPTSTPPAPAKAADAAPKFKALVAEDNSVNQRLVQRMLENLGGSVDIASDGREAVTLAMRSDYDVVLMDCFMPEMDGYEATGQIRKQMEARGSKRVPIIALTANALPSDREKCLAAGMDDYLSKPVRKEEIKAALERRGVLSESTLDHTAIHA